MNTAKSKLRAIGLYMGIENLDFLPKYKQNWQDLVPVLDKVRDETNTTLIPSYNIDSNIYSTGLITDDHKVIYDASGESFHSTVFSILAKYCIDYCKKHKLKYEVY